MYLCIYVFMYFVYLCIVKAKRREKRKEVRKKKKIRTKRKKEKGRKKEKKERKKKKKKRKKKKRITCKYLVGLHNNFLIVEAQ